MGSVGYRDDETPRHSVFVSAFEMAVTAVTNAHYRIYLEETGAEPPAWIETPGFDAPDQPVVGVNWTESRAFCRWLSSRSGLCLRLPTEAEREKAARGGVEGALFPWGDQANGGGHLTLEGPLSGPDRVASLSPNGYGLYNMADSIHEWCLDGYLADFYRDSPADNPRALNFKRRSARGGSWRHQVVITRSAARSSLPPSFHYSDFGFRWIRAVGLETNQNPGHGRRVAARRS